MNRNKSELRPLTALLCAMLILYLLPLAIRDTGSAMSCLLVYMPTALLFVGMWLGIKQGFYWLYALGTAMLFLPTVWLYYNSSALIYAPVYGVLALVGNLLGSGLRLIRSRNKKL